MQYIDHIVSSIQKGIRHESKLSNDALNVQGFSGIQGLHFLNNLSNIPGITYFEVGTWMGSTLIASSYQNQGNFTGMDNYCQFQGQVEFDNYRKSFVDDCKFNFHKADCWNIDLDLLPHDIDIYFFDGPHAFNDQKKALTHYISLMNKEFIYLIDDWNSPLVRNGTLAGIEACNVKVKFRADIRPDLDSHKPGWWNGFGIFVLEKLS